MNRPQRAKKEVKEPEPVEDKETKRKPAAKKATKKSSDHKVATSKVEKPKAAQPMRQKTTASHKATANKNAGTRQKAAAPKTAAPSAAGVKRKKGADDEDHAPSKGKSKPAPSKRVRSHALPQLEPVSHASHGKVGADLFVWGDGGCGQLGLGEDEVEKTRPFPVSIDGKKVLQVACGGMHTVALTQDGQVYTWGVNDEGALGRETEGELWNTSPLKTGSVRPSDVPVHVPIPAHIVQITAGDSHSCALTTLGSVYSWGTFRDAGGVMGFSADQRIQLLPVLVYEAHSADEQLLQISSGADHVWGVSRQGKVLSWGNGQQGQLGRIGSRINDRQRLVTMLTPHEVPVKRKRGISSRVREVSCGTYDAFVLLENGTVYGCGLNNYGQLALPALEPVWALTLLPALTDIARLKPGQHHTLALKNDGTLLSCGRPTYGRLGREGAPVASDEPLPEPAAVDGISAATVVGLAAGLAVSGCFAEDGSAYLWGFGSNSQLARGDDDDDAITPAKLGVTKRLKGSKVVALEFGGQHAALLAAPEEEAAVQPAAAPVAAPAPTTDVPMNGVAEQGDEQADDVGGDDGDHAGAEQEEGVADMGDVEDAGNGQQEDVDMANDGEAED